MIARYKFCLWLVNKLSMHRLTLAEITDQWSRSDSNISGDVLTPRTFLRYKALAEEIFNVNIECYKPTNEYWLDMDALDESDRWIMSALQVHKMGHHHPRWHRSTGNRATRHRSLRTIHQINNLKEEKIWQDI